MLEDIKVEVISLKLMSFTKPLRAFATIKLFLNGCVLSVADFRVVKHEGSRTVVNVPQSTWRDEQTGDLKYKPIIEFPVELKELIDLEILNRFQLEIRRASEKAG